jgi:glutamine synthetase type III
VTTQRPVWDFKGKHLLRGETDGSSFPTGGLRKTHTAAGCVAASIVCLKIVHPRVV